MLRLQAPLAEGYSTTTPEDLSSRIAAAKAELGDRLMILGHHYQRDEVMAWADARGDSFGLSRLAAASKADFVVFCGVHFMAESADVLTGPDQQVILPDLNAGCSMADMADLDEVEEAWDSLAAVTDVEAIVPITYMNSSAALKAFVGRHGGAVCTSSNARQILTWALDQHGPDTKVLFFPDQHLGRNTAYQLGFGAGDMAVWDPRRDLGGLDEATVKGSRFLLWKGHCSVHQRFRPAHIEAFRAAHPDGVVIVHPECSHEVVELADQVGSTDFIIATVERIEKEQPGAHISIATEIHLVQRLAAEHPTVHIESLDPLICPCSTMFRIDAAHLAWVLEELVAGRVVNRITVDDATAGWARVALQRMLEIS
ncbi:MAG TPA: quinolinate synthase NadA [Acidimicrobiales bacterium]|jgi:quinolinate synthase|nr:quinolinate synthase NadA [Acidimicrobiales bacterium]